MSKAKVVKQNDESISKSIIQTTLDSYKLELQKANQIEDKLREQLQQNSVVKYKLEGAIIALSNFVKDS